MEEIYILLFVTGKIRKREDSSVGSAVDSRYHPHHNHNHQNQQQQPQQQFQQNLNQVVHQNQGNGVAKGNGESVQPQQQQQNNSVWVFPPLPPQPNIYGFNQLALMQANQDKHGFKGLKRQLSGRFKRLISRKPNEPPTPTIPPELKPQLKTIYVY